MRHSAKLDWWIVFAALVGTLAPLLTHVYWASGIVLGIQMVRDPMPLARVSHNARG